MEKQQNAMRLSSLDLSAEVLGLRYGQNVVEARAIYPELDIVPADHKEDMRFLNALADWADRYTPLVGIDAPFDKPRGLFLDITGCAHLFGGEEKMLQDIIWRLNQIGIYAQGAIAPTPGLAWGVARQGTIQTYNLNKSIINIDHLEQVVSTLSMAALRLPLDMLMALDRVGLKHVKDIRNLPRKPLMRRFGPLLLKRLDQLLGDEEEPISPRLPVSQLSVERRLAEPIGQQEDIEICIEQLAGSLKDDMEKRGAAGQKFTLSLFRMDGIVRRLDIGLSAPSRDPGRIKALFSEKLAVIYDESDAGTGFETVRLSLRSAITMSEQQSSFSNNHNLEETIDRLADRMIARMGPDCVLSATFYESYIPERAAAFVPLIDQKKNRKPEDGSCHKAFEARPIRLFSNPEPINAIAEVPEGPPITFGWRRSQYQVARAEGPERIAAEWWVDGKNALTRDYYRVEDKSGRRFWIFREGLYERECNITSNIMPRWFMHGLFA